MRSNNQNGSIPILLVLFLPLLVGMVGFSADFGKLFVTKSELQNAADACALASIAQFDNLSTNEKQEANAIAAGKSTAKKNLVFFQKRLLSDNEITVSFLSTLNGKSGKYARCQITHAGITNWIIPIINTIGGSVKSSESLTVSATATTIPSQTSCALPIGICQTNLTGKKPGDWLEGIASPNSKSNGKGKETEADTLLSGHFKWVDFTQENNSTNELGDILNGQQATNCSVAANPNQYVGTPGYRASLREDYNTRFGIYKKNTNQSPIYPDISGKSYYDKSKTNQYIQDFIVKAAPVNAPYSPITGIDINQNSYNILPSQDLKKFGSNRRLTIAPVVDCSTFKLKSFACVFLLHPMPTKSGTDFPMYIEYLGDASNSITPCNKQGGAVGGGSNFGPRKPALVQ